MLEKIDVLSKDRELSYKDLTASKNFRSLRESMKDFRSTNENNVKFYDGIDINNSNSSSLLRFI